MEIKHYYKNRSKYRNRYFLVSYVSSHPTLGVTITGDIDFTCTNGAYLNRIRTVEIIEQKAKVVSVVITNIIELCYADWQRWVEKN